MNNIYNGLVALNNFWNSFNIPAYEVSTIPDSAVMPYITYEGSVDDLNHPIATTASLYYQGKSWKAITEKLQEISDKLGAGYYEEMEEGALLIQKASPFAQRVAEESEQIRRYIINVSLEYIF